MTKRQAERYAHLIRACESLGIDKNEVDSLLRCERILSTWAEHECNGNIQRDEETNIPYWYNTDTGKCIGRTADRETGALNRAKTIAERHDVTVYHQGDPRGCALWIIRPGDVRDGHDVNACYSNGIAVCID